MRRGLIKLRDRWSFGGKGQEREGDVVVATISESKIHE
jgi:hypothetical protein